MAEATEEAIRRDRHLVVQAGTGTGKTLAYLVPALRSGQRIVVTTATKALQDQLAGKDLPLLAAHLDVPFEWAVLKGRSNYICLQRLREMTGDQEAQRVLELEDVGASVRREVARLATWAATSPTGDQAELTWPVSPRAWQAVSVTSEECPGASRCPLGEACLAELARRKAAVADVVVVNTYLYGLNLAIDESLLPEHDVVVIDEAHQLEDVVSATAGVSISGSRIGALARHVRAVLADDGATLPAAGDALAGVLSPNLGQRLDPLPAEVGDALVALRTTLDRVLGELRAIETDLGDANQRKARAQKAATALVDDLDVALCVPATHIAWVGGTAAAPRLEVAPIDVAGVLAPLWARRTAILTSATIPAHMIERVGLPAAGTDALDVGSPFDYEDHALLYCAAHLPDPRQARFAPLAHEELAYLIAAAGGRTLALFTSWRAMTAAADALAPRLPYRVLTQADLPKPELLAAFARDETSCLFATVGLFQGIDVPGPALSLVAIDRIPFPRPDEPLLQARRERAGPDAFRLIDLPRATTLLAQAAGRLIRTATDRGVVAVLDSPSGPRQLPMGRRAGAAADATDP